METLRRHLFRRIDPASLVAFRVVFGVTVVVSAFRYFWYGWIDAFFYQRDFFFTFLGFEWVRPLPPPGMEILFGLLIVCGIAIAAGYRYRLATAVFFLGFTWVGLIDKANYLNHYWFVRFVAFLMIFMPLGRVGSIDAFRTRVDGDDDSPTLRAWPLWTLRLQIGLLYFFAGVAKLQPDWLLRGQPLDIWLAKHAHFPVVGPLFDTSWFPVAMSAGGAAFDLAVFPALLWHRTRPWAYVAVIVFHVATGALFNIGMFPVIMIALTTIFFEPDWPRRWFPDSWFRAVGLARPSAKEKFDPPSPTAERLLVGGLAMWFALQIAAPMRHLAYPGKVLWTHEGFRFSWRVMLVEKNGHLTYGVRAPDTGEQWRVHAAELVGPRREKLAATIPGMAHELALHVEEKFRERGYRDVDVRADAWVSLHGRPAQRIIDPEVDLSERPRRLGHQPWILPLRDVAETEK